MNKAARARQEKNAERRAVKNDAAILEARSKRRETHAAIRSAKKQYKNDKRMVGKVVAREILNKNLKKPLRDLDKASELTRKEQRTQKIINAAFGLSGVGANELASIIDRQVGGRVETALRRSGR
jgi:hypothetical protein